jgi:hypothetical protein
VEQIEQVAGHFVTVFDYYASVLPYMRRLIQLEVEKTGNFTISRITLFVSSWCMTD